MVKSGFKSKQSDSKAHILNNNLLLFLGSAPFAISSALEGIVQIMAECRESSKTSLPLLRGGGKIQALESAILGFGSQLSY